MVSIFFVYPILYISYSNEYDNFQISMIIKMKKKEIHKNDTIYLIEKEIDYKFLIL